MFVKVKYAHKWPTHSGISKVIIFIIMIYTYDLWYDFVFLSALSWCQAVGIVYSGLQVLSERSAMVTKALDYIGDILKHIKPSLVSKNQEGLQLAYRAVGTCKTHRYIRDTQILYSGGL